MGEVKATLMGSLVLDRQALVERVLSRIPAGKLVRVWEHAGSITITPEPSQTGRKRIGFLEGQIAAPPDFDAMGQEEIVSLFAGDLDV
jgi:hypothetical protein